MSILEDLKNSTISLLTVSFRDFRSLLLNGTHSKPYSGLFKLTPKVTDVTTIGGVHFLVTYCAARTETDE